MNKIRKTPLKNRGAWLGEWCDFCDRRNVIGYEIEDELWLKIIGDQDAVACLTYLDEQAEKLQITYNINILTKPLQWHCW